jgi:hypothetical protein
MAAGPAFGGFITYTTVTREGIETDVIHEWPDYVGRPIDDDPAQMGRIYALSEDELDALAGEPRRRSSDDRTNVEDMDRRGIDAEIARIAKIMRENRREYKLNHSARYRELLSARY